MNLTSTLGSPGVEIREIDNSIRLDSSSTTTIFIPGFSSQGPVDEVMSIGTISDFETIYGTPTNAAERYFYYTVKAILDNSGTSTTVLCSRLPYGDDLGDTVSNAYTMLAYPAIPVVKKNYKKATTETGWEIITDENTKIDDAATLSEVSFDFDQFILPSSNAEKAFVKAFNIIQTTDDESKTLAEASIEEYYFSIDDDDTITDLSVTKIDSTNSIVPSIGDLIVFSENIKNIAPTIDFNNNTYKAEGIISVEVSDTTTNDVFLHASYSLKNTNNSTNVGSLYVKIKYSNVSLETIRDKSFEGLSEKIDSLKFSLVKSNEIAESYDGQRNSQNSSENDSFSDDVTYIIGSPVAYQVSLNDYYKILTGELLKWSRKPYSFSDELSTVSEGDEDDDTEISTNTFGKFDAIGHSAFIVLNTSRSIINNNFEGFYLGLTDNTFTTQSDDNFIFNAVENVKITTESYNSTDNDGIGLIDKSDNTGNYQTLNSNRLAFQLDTNSQGSISKILARDISSRDISSTNYDDTISMGLFKLTRTSDDSDILKLNYSLREKYNWSFGKNRMKSTTSSTKPVSYFAENIMENSKNMAIMMNPYVAEKGFVDTNGRVHGKMRVLGNKLIKNLESVESKYLRKTYTDITATQNVKTVYASVAAKLAQSSINSWKDTVKQAGVTPRFLKQILNSNDTYTNFQPLNSLLPFGAYTDAESSDKKIGELPAKIERALSLVENDEMYPDIDIVLEAGLGTIYVNAKGDIESDKTDSEISGKSVTSQSGIDTYTNTFDESKVLRGIEDLRTSRSSLTKDAQNVKENYNAIQAVFTQFANSMQNGGRGDTFYISDVPRGILIKGKDTKIANLFGTKLENNTYEFGETVNHSFPTSIYYPIFHTFDNIVSSYMSTYAQWVKILDNHSAQKIWIPVSGYIAANMAATDAVYGPWYAAAGLRRGVINGVLDYAISPTVSQRTDLYKICINSVPKIPNYGVTIWGIRTMSKKDSAFDQNTCRRTFLYMEKKIKQLLRYYIFEPNTSYTRLQIFNDIDPFLEKIKNNGGIYSYQLVTDTTINTPDVINNGDLAVRISAAPTRTAENIVVEFVANKVSEEVTSSETY